MSLIRSASLIILNSLKNEIQKPNFNLLMLKRIASSQSFAGKIVFPGGTLDQSDYSEKWQPIIDKQFSKFQLESLGGSNLPIYGDSRTFHTTLTPEIFYRICAIRETFEETGILLARNGSKKSVISDRKLLQDIKLHNWQDKVARQGDFFFDMCMSYDIAPDLLVLKEWSEWLTPAAYKRRFNAVFFIAIVNEILTTTINRSEYEEFFWKTPKNAFDDHFEKNELAPPQALELFNISLFSSWQHVDREAANRKPGKIKANTGVVFNLSNGQLFVFLGDSRFQDGMEFEENEFFFPAKSVEDFGSDSPKRRIIMKEKRIFLETNSYLKPSCL